MHLLRWFAAEVRRAVDRRRGYEVEQDVVQSVHEHRLVQLHGDHPDGVDGRHEDAVFVRQRHYVLPRDRVLH